MRQPDARARALATMLGVRYSGGDPGAAARLGAKLRGWMRYELVDRSGIIIRAGAMPNLILDQGLDQIASQSLLFVNDAGAAPTTWFPIIQYCAVGTDSTAPAASQTGLGTELARTNTTYTTDTMARPSNGTYQLTRHVEFDYAQANGNLTEWGFSYASAAGGNLFNRALFLDGGGSPTTVTKTSSYKLRIIYTLEIALSPTSMTAGSFAVTGVGTVSGNYVLLGTSSASLGADCAAPDLGLFSALARGGLGTVDGIAETPAVGALYADDTDRSGLTYINSISVLGDSSAPKHVARTIDTARDAYVAGSFQRTGGLWKFGTSYGNFAPIKAFAISGAEERDDGCQQMGYVFDLDLASEFAKDDLHTLTIGVPTVSWARV